MDPQTISTLVGVGVFSLIFAGYLFRLARRQRFQAQLRKRLGADERDGASLLKGDDQARSSSDFARALADSGLGWSVSDAILRTVGVAFGAAFVALVLFHSVGGALLFGALGVVVVPIYIRRTAAARKALCDQQMPQALEIMSLALRAGHPLPTALSIAAAEAPAPIRDELGRAVDEHELGRPIGDVLVALGDRLKGSEAVHTFVVAVLVLQQTGGNLIGVIDRIVENARARAQYHAKLRALTSEGRSSAKMLAIMPVAFGILAAMVDPTYTHVLFGERAGLIIFGICLGLWLLGLLWTNQLVKTE